MKAWMVAGMMIFALSASTMAMAEGEQAAAATPAAEEHAGANCPMHAEKNKVLLDAAKALEGTNAELAGKLKDMAAKCCS